MDRVLIFLLVLIPNIVFAGWSPDIWNRTNTFGKYVTNVMQSIYYVDVIEEKSTTNSMPVRDQSANSYIYDPMGYWRFEAASTNYRCRTNAYYSDISLNTNLLTNAWSVVYTSVYASCVLCTNAYYVTTTVSRTALGVETNFILDAGYRREKEVFDAILERYDGFVKPNSIIFYQEYRNRLPLLKSMLRTVATQYLDMGYASFDPATNVVYDFSSWFTNDFDGDNYLSNCLPPLYTATGILAQCGLPTNYFDYTPYKDKTNNYSIFEITNVFRYLLCQPYNSSYETNYAVFSYFNTDFDEGTYECEPKWSTNAVIQNFCDFLYTGDDWIDAMLEYGYETLERHTNEYTTAGLYSSWGTTFYLTHRYLNGTNLFRLQTEGRHWTISLKTVTNSIAAYDNTNYYADVYWGTPNAVNFTNTAGRMAKIDSTNEDFYVVTESEPISYILDTSAFGYFQRLTNESQVVLDEFTTEDFYYTRTSGGSDIRMEEAVIWSDEANLLYGIIDCDGVGTPTLYDQSLMWWDYDEPCIENDFWEVGASAQPFIIKNYSDTFQYK